MTPEERSAFEKEVAADDELRDQLEFTLTMKSVLKSRYDKLQSMKEWEEEDNASPSVPKPIPLPTPEPTPIQKRRKMWIFVSGIAALFVLGYFVVGPALYLPLRVGSGQDNGGSEVLRGGDDPFGIGESSALSEEENAVEESDSLDNKPQTPADNSKVRQDEP